MNASEEDIYPRRSMKVSKEEILQTNISHRQSHHHYYSGGRVATLLTRGGKMVVNMRNIIELNSIIQWLLIQMQEHVGY